MAPVEDQEDHEEWIIQSVIFPLEIHLTRKSTSSPLVVKISTLKLEMEFRGEALDHRLEHDNRSNPFQEDWTGYPNDEEITTRLLQRLQQEFANRSISAPTVRSIAGGIMIYAQKWLHNKPVNVAISMLSLISDQNVEYKVSWCHEKTFTPL